MVPVVPGSGDRVSGVDLRPGEGTARDLGDRGSRPDADPRSRGPSGSRSPDGIAAVTGVAKSIEFAADRAVLRHRDRRPTRGPQRERPAPHEDAATRAVARATPKTARTDERVKAGAGRAARAARAAQTEEMREAADPAGPLAAALRAVLGDGRVGERDGAAADEETAAERVAAIAAIAAASESGRRAEGSAVTAVSARASDRRVRLEQVALARHRAAGDEVRRRRWPSRPNRRCLLLLRRYRRVRRCRRVRPRRRRPRRTRRSTSGCPRRHTDRRPGPRRRPPRAALELPPGRGADGSLPADGRVVQERHLRERDGAAIHQQPAADRGVAAQDSARSSRRRPRSSGP